jgi:transcriptional regulator with XRE-family HTH domain
MRGRREEELIAPSPSENGLGITIRAWRHFRGLTVTDLAIQAGFGKNGRGYISRIEHSQIRHLGEERLKRIAAVLQLQSIDLLLHRMPEASEETLTHDLDDAIIGGRALLKRCREKSFDWARVQLLLAKLYCELATTSQTTSAKHTALIQAQRCIESSLLVFTADTAPQSFPEATRLRQEIRAVLDASILTGCTAFLKRCSPQSLDWARIHVLLAKFHREQADVSQGQVARDALIKAQQCIEVALSIFTQKGAQRNVKEASQLYQEITHAILQMDEL